MDLHEARQAWFDDGYVVLPGYLPPEVLAPAVDGLGRLFPSGDDFHDGVDPDRNARFVGDEFDGIDAFPFASLALNRVPFSEPLRTLATTFLDQADIRLYSAEAWAKYEGAADYDQDLHRDYLNHTVLVPSEDPAFRQLECFVFLSDVTPDLGAPRMVRRSEATDALLAKPNFFPRTDRDGDDAGFVSPGRPDLYDVEVPATGPAGTVVAFQPQTVHRGSAITQPRGSRFTMHLNYRPAAAEWAHRHAWADRSHHDDWYAFVAQATPEQLALVGFPPPGHAYWTEQTVAGVGQRYPGLDLTAWRAGLGGSRHARATAPRLT